MNLVFIAFASIALLLFSKNAVAQQAATPVTATFSGKIAGLQKFSGFFTFYHDVKTDKIWLEIEKSQLDRDFLYAVSLPQGIGSNDIGLDRGQLSGERVVRLERHGSKLLLVQPNLNFRAVTTNANEQRAVAESFAQSVLHGFKIEAEEGSKMLVDASSFFLRDAHGVALTLKRTGQGAYNLALEQSAIYLPR
ncbi:MAG: DUF5118 domain-containing protein, partial [Candidatus Kapaibacteriota bacterium]